MMLGFALHLCENEGGLFLGCWASKNGRSQLAALALTSPVPTPQRQASPGSWTHLVGGPGQCWACKLVTGPWSQPRGHSGGGQHSVLDERVLSVPGTVHSLSAHVP